MICRSLLLQISSSLLLAVIYSHAVIADTANFGQLTLSSDLNPIRERLTGYTGGSYSLSVISERDRDKNICIGFADPTPDHILVLKKDFANLKIQVNSGGNDTTLLVKGPHDSTIRCGDDTGKNKDASISDSKWKAGVYKIWVGSFNRGKRRNYTLSIAQPPKIVINDSENPRQ